MYAYISVAVGKQMDRSGKIIAGIKCQTIAETLKYISIAFRYNGICIKLTKECHHTKTFIFIA